jgi:PKD repeat protein
MLINRQAIRIVFLLAALGPWMAHPVSAQLLTQSISLSGGGSFKAPLKINAGTSFNLNFNAISLNANLSINGAGFREQISSSSGSLSGGPYPVVLEPGNYTLTETYSGTASSSNSLVNHPSVELPEVTFSRSISVPNKATYMIEVHTAIRDLVAFVEGPFSGSGGIEGVVGGSIPLTLVSQKEFHKDDAIEFTAGFTATLASNTRIEVKNEPPVVASLALRVENAGDNGEPLATSTLVAVASGIDPEDGQLGESGLVYRWLKNGSPLPGATSQTLSGSFVEGDRLAVEVVAIDSGGKRSEQSLVSNEIVIQNAPLAQEPPAPVVQEVDPPEGSILGGELIFIIGENFDPDTPGTVVEIGGNLAIDVIVKSEAIISAITPPGDSPGVVDVVVVNPDGQAGRLPEGFIYIISAGGVVVDAGEDQTMDEGGTLRISVQFTAVGGALRFTATVDWGDGVVDSATLNSIGGLGVVLGTHVYAESGEYTATVTVTDDTGQSGSDTFTVTVNNLPPQVDTLTLGPSPANEGDTVTLTATFIDPGASDTHIVQIDWGDGELTPETTADGAASATHRYADNGEYTVSVIVRDDEEAVGRLSQTVVVENVAPTVEAGENRSVDRPNPTVTLNAVFTDPGLLDTHTATIDWGDGDQQAVRTAVSPITATHTYTGDGNRYTVTVTVADDDGGAGSDSFEVVIVDTAPTVDAQGPEAAVEGEVVMVSAVFTVPTPGEGYTASIDWGDGVIDESPPISVSEAGGELTATHIYQDNGLYRVVVTVAASEGDSGSDTLTIAVANVAPAVNAGDDQATPEGDALTIDVRFTDAGVLDTHTATIDWGDGAPVATARVEPVAGGGRVSASRVYADDGVYTVTITVADDDGGVGSDTLVVTVNNTPPVVEAGNDRTVDASNPTVSVNATFTDLGALDTHTAVIDWGDGATETVEPATSPVIAAHAYPSRAATYTLTVTVTDDDEERGSDSFRVTVSNAAPVVEAGNNQTVDEGNPTISLSATFTDSSTQETHTAAIDWGDGGMQTMPVTTGPITARHTYPRDNGSYTVAVAITDSLGASGSDTFVVTVVNLPPVVDAGGDATAEESDPTIRLNATFTDPGQGDTHRATIDWGDGDAETIDPATSPIARSHVYPRAAATYTVRVAVVDDDGGAASDTFTVAVRDTTPPEATKITPEIATQAAPVTSSIQIVFSEPVNVSAVSNAVSVTGANNRRITGRATFDAATSTLTFTPDAPFRDEETITVVVTTAVTDLAGNAPASQISARFITGLGVWPGDANNDGRVSITDLLPLGQYWNLTGDRRQQANATWRVQPAAPWTPTKRATYADTNGDGVVNAEDIIPIAQNWGQLRVPSTSSEQAPLTSAAPLADEDRSAFYNPEWFDVYQAMYSVLENAPFENEGVQALRRIIGEMMESIKRQITPTESRLLQNYPNPFNPETWMPYQLAQPAFVRISIYDINGKLIRTLDLGEKPAGYYLSKDRAAYWDGRNALGEQVTSGVYFYRLEAGTFESVRKLIVVK